MASSQRRRSGLRRLETTKPVARLHSASVRRGEGARCSALLALTVYNRNPSVLAWLPCASPHFILTPPAAAMAPPAGSAFAAASGL